MVQSAGPGTGEAGLNERTDRGYRRLQKSPTSPSHLFFPFLQEVQARAPRLGMWAVLCWGLAGPSAAMPGELGWGAFLFFELASEIFEMEADGLWDIAKAKTGVDIICREQDEQRRPNSPNIPGRILNTRHVSPHHLTPFPMPSSSIHAPHIAQSHSHPPPHTTRVPAPALNISCAGLVPAAWISLTKFQILLHLGKVVVWVLGTCRDLLGHDCNLRTVVVKDG